MDEYERVFGDSADYDVDWLEIVHSWTKDEMIYFIKKCLETNTLIFVFITDPISGDLVNRPSKSRPNRNLVIQETDTCDRL